jgi:L-ribulose-5-phosphate 3-epimerase
MWSETAANPIMEVKAARDWVKQRMANAGLAVEEVA